MKQKYFSKKVTNSYGTFDSLHEFRHYLFLLDRQKKGEIYGLRKQVSIEIIPKRIVNVIKRLKTKDKLVTRVDEQKSVYTCDFAYYDNTLNKYVMVEFKSPMTAKLSDYILRRKLAKQVIDKHNKKKAFNQWVFVEVIMNGNKKNKILRKKFTHGYGIQQIHYSSKRNRRKQSGWISVKERLPEYNKRVIVLHKNRRIDTSIYHEDNNWSMFDSDIVAWMATPSFDEILETNKDVLTQFKDKGD